METRSRVNFSGLPVINYSLFSGLGLASADDLDAILKEIEAEEKIANGKQAAKKKGKGEFGFAHAYFRLKLFKWKVPL